MRIFHIASAADWERARAEGTYTTSTRGRTLAEEGFIHASRGDQWQGVRDRFYADVDEPLVLLAIDTERLGVPVAEEAVPDSSETFPHIYGALDPEAVVQVLPLEQRLPVAPRAPSESFHALFLGELLFRAGVGFAVILAAGVLARLAQAALGNAAALLVAALVLVAGGVVGVRLSRARDQRYAAERGS